MPVTAGAKATTEQHRGKKNPKACQERAPLAKRNISYGRGLLAQGSHGRRAPIPCPPDPACWTERWRPHGRTGPRKGTGGSAADRFADCRKRTRCHRRVCRQTFGGEWGWPSLDKPAGNTRAAWDAGHVYTRNKGKGGTGRAATHRVRGGGGVGNNQPRAAPSAEPVQTKPNHTPQTHLHPSHTAHNLPWAGEASRPTI
jgi:hypothetical protein